MAAFLLDENLSPVVAEQINRKQPGAQVISIHRWRNGEFLSVEDGLLLEAAFEEALTLVTCDLSTLLPLLKDWGEAGRSHAGVIFVDDKSIPNNDYGRLVEAILQAWERLKTADFTNGVLFLQAPPQRA
jgi:hypothetical protein